MRQARVGIARPTCGDIRTADHARPNAREIDRANDRPVVAFRIDLNQVDVRKPGDAQRAFDRMTRHRLGDDVAIRNAMLAKMLPIERRRHRSMAPVTIEIARAFAFRDRRLQQRHLPLVAIRLLQSGKRGRLRLDQHAAKVVRRDQLAKVVLAHAVERADLQKRHPRIGRAIHCATTNRKLLRTDSDGSRMRIGGVKQR